MQINWKVRAKNPIFWAQVVAMAVLTLIGGTGMAWEDMTSWPVLGSTLLSAVLNPVTVVAVVIAVWTAVTDPTTAGIGDSNRAMTYEEPYKEEE